MASKKNAVVLRTSFEKETAGQSLPARLVACKRTKERDRKKFMDILMEDVDRSHSVPKMMTMIDERKR